MPAVVVGVGTGRPVQEVNLVKFDYMRSVRPMIAMLAADAAAQVRTTPPTAQFAVDVLDDADLVFETAIGANGRGLSENEKRVVAELRARVDAITSDVADSFWTDEALRSDPRWEAIRVAARATLDRLDELRGSAPAQP